MAVAVGVTSLACSSGAWAQSAPASEAALVAKGKRLFMMCSACHDISAIGAARVGPHLAGIVGRQAGSVAGYSYSPALAAKPFDWDEAKLDAWLLKPSAVVPTTKMAYMGMPNAEDRKAMVAFLGSLK
ncbi:c-type cytochrome [Roseateles sp. SL47]|uniref:c-type cytochrome n=1 Tax=Roseateles sp. SL47 TaxID=2995138 RepID=UPI002270DCC4|nr:c-type cytochrome [Roseateles sp. SL47]WAC71948.1 c-type cytochrome [Roseateles sp. SL47]